MKKNTRTFLIILIILLTAGLSTTLAIIWKDHQRNYTLENKIDELEARIHQDSIENRFKSTVMFGSRSVTTGPITNADADSMWQAYMHGDNLMWTPPYDGYADNDTLEGLNISLDTIDPLLRAPGITNLHILFGQVNGANEVYTKIIIMGFDSDSMIITDKKGPMLYEYCDPCPPNCPSNIRGYFRKR